LYLFQGIDTLMPREPSIAIGRIVLIVIRDGLCLSRLQRNTRRTHHDPHGIGMAAVNGAVLFFSATHMGRSLSTRW